MERSSKKHTKFLMLILAIIISISIGINLLMNLTSFGNTGSTRSGVFDNISQGIDSNGWYLFAEEAQGHSTFFTNLTQTDLDNLLIEGRIQSGQMILVITQGNVRLDFDLSEIEIEITAREIGVEVLEPGRVEMRLYFTDAQNINVVTSWHERR